MEQYISKSALVAEIENRIKETESMQPKFDQFWAGQISAFKGVLKIIDTLEVKEVDINKEISQFIDANFEKAKIGHKLSLRRTAKHFFELGLSVSNKAEKEVEEYPYVGKTGKFTTTTK